MYLAFPTFRSHNSLNSSSFFFIFLLFFFFLLLFFFYFLLFSHHSCLFSCVYGFHNHLASFLMRVPYSWRQWFGYGLLGSIHRPYIVDFPLTLKTFKEIRGLNLFPIDLICIVLEDVPWTILLYWVEVTPTSTLTTYVSEVLTIKGRFAGLTGDYVWVWLFPLPFP